jgi:type II secretory ATPase GspE/PulE/Tfp pilus assembly ATPase PilB-like protein
VVVSHERFAAGPQQETLTIDPVAVGRVPEALALRYDVLALASDSNELAIAIPDIDDRETIERVRFATGMRVRAIAAPRDLIRQHLSVAYSVVAPATSAHLAEGSRTIGILQEIIERASEHGTSDIHIEPTESRARVRFRVDGVLLDDDGIEKEVGERVVARIKLLAGMDIADRRLPQDGRCAFSVAGRSIDARVASMPTIHGEKIVVRLLDYRGRPPGLSQLGMTDEMLEDVRALTAAAHGLIIVCGPTGSGKTTTLYASLMERSHPGVHVCTVEDPVEMQLAGIVQVQVNERTGLTYAAALRAMVRQDPDIVMIGEMRDAETAAAAMSAALAGRLVITTLHCVDAAAAIDRMVEFGIARSVLAHTVVGIVAQRLIRRNAPSGRGARTGLFEYLPLNDALRSAIERGASRFELRELGRTLGYRPLADAAAELLASRVVSRAEIARVLGESACGE